MPRVLKQDFTVTLGDLLSLLRGGALALKIRPSDGSTGVEAQVSLQLSGDVPAATRSKAIELLLSTQKGYLDSWVVRPDGYAIPAVGTEAWIAYIVTNADRLMLKDGLGVVQALSKFAVDDQAAIIAGWAKSDYTPLPAVADYVPILAAISPPDPER